MQEDKEAAYTLWREYGCVQTHTQVRTPALMPNMFTQTHMCAQTCVHAHTHIFVCTPECRRVLMPPYNVCAGMSVHR